MTREGFFDYQKPSAKIFNLRQDPFEQRDGQKADDIAMALGVAYGGQIADLAGRTLRLVGAVPAAAKKRHAEDGYHGEVNRAAPVAAR